MNPTLHMRRHRQIALLGFPGVGKSSLAHHFVYKHYYNEYDPNIKTNLQHQCVIANEPYDLLIVDNAGSDQYSISHSDFDNSDAYILVYAIDDRQSFEMVSKIREKILSTSAITRIPMVLVGNKIDRKEERRVTSEEGRLLAHAWNVQFIEASAMDLEAVQKMFEKSICAINHNDSQEVPPVDTPVKDSSTGKSITSSRNSSSKKSTKNASASQDQSSNSSCSIM